METLTALDVIRRSAEHLAQRGVETARLDAELMLAKVLGLTRLDLYMQFERPLTPEERDAARAMLARRAKREPLSQILGEREFHSLVFEVTPDVLTPRPETELIVEEMIRLHEIGSLPEGSIADVGTGSGAIAVSLAYHLPGRAFVATDSSKAAIAVAQRNAGRHGVADRIEFREGDLFAGAAVSFAAVVSNPPYIGANERRSLAPEVLREPEEALFAAENGLAVIRRLVSETPERLAPNGHLLIEHGHTQAEAVRALMKEGGFIDVRSIQDLAGIERVAAGRLP